MSRKLSEVDQITLQALSYRELVEKVSDIWWDERTKVGMMDDKHLANAINKLQGYAKEQYEGSDELKAKWIYILRLEQEKRVDMRKANKTDSTSERKSHNV